MDLVAQAAKEDTSLMPYIITGPATLVVGLITGATETREKVREDFVAVFEAMGIIEFGDEVELITRQAAAGKALRGLLSISFMMPGVGGHHLDDLLDALKMADEASLEKALAQWPSVSAAIRRKPPNSARRVCP